MIYGVECNTPFSEDCLDLFLSRVHGFWIKPGIPSNESWYVLCHNQLRLYRFTFFFFFFLKKITDLPVIRFIGNYEFLCGREFVIQIWRDMSCHTHYSKILTRDFSTCGKLGFKLEILTSLNSLEAVDVLFFWPFPVQSFWIVLIGFGTLGA